MSQTLSVDDTLTSTLEDNEGSEIQEDMHAESADTAADQHTIRGPNKQCINADNIQRKHKRIKHLPAVTLTAIRSTGNPNHHNTRAQLQYSDKMGVSVFVAGAPLRRNDYGSFYAVKGELTGDQYRAQFPMGITSLTDCEISPHTTIILPKQFGYSTDSLWEITMSLEGDRESRRNHISRIRNTDITEEEAVTYLLAIP